ncbi:MAG: TetR/AcrR family transcriptional regulator C-terminal domain-containing protein [Psychrobacillus sp.]
MFDKMNFQTKKKIQQSFLSILKGKEFTKISIKDITDSACINRGTFYLHYLDKYDLLEKVEEELLEGLRIHIAAIDSEYKVEMVEQLQVAGFSMEVFRYIEQHVDQFIVLLSKYNTSGFHLRLKNFFIEQFEENYHSSEMSSIDPTIPTDYLSAFAASAILGLIEQWLTRQQRETPEEVAELYLKILNFIKSV